MLKFFNYLFAFKTLMMIVLIEQIKHHNQSAGLSSSISLGNEILLAVLWPGIFGLIFGLILIIANITNWSERKV